jgi:hypothetical protein
MIRLLTVSLVAVAVLTAPVAVADPNNLVPECGSGQVPEAGQCNANPQDGTFGDAPGGNPNTQTGLTPQLQPVVAGLGLTPGNLPVVLPVGVTPPTVVAGR